MRSLLIAMALLSACKKMEDSSFTQAQAESSAAKIFGIRSICFGDSISAAWTCMAVESAPAGGPIVYRPQPIVVCLGGSCRRVEPEGSCQCSTMKETK